MCLLAIAYNVHPAFPLLVAANRDEFTDRPTEPLHFWSDAPHILAGRDLKAGGTWLGISRHGRFAALTNHRDMRRQARQGPSRGELVRDMLEQDTFGKDTSIYEGFNLIHGHWRSLHYHNNIDGTWEPLADGVHALSNAFLDTPWPKVVRASAAMRKIATDADPDVEEMFTMLTDEKPAPRSELPDTGVGVEWEEILSTIRIRTEHYGTRCSTVVMVNAKGEAYVEERTFGANAEAHRTSTRLTFSAAI